MSLFAEIVFWGALAALVYMYGGFSVLVAVWGSVRKRPVRRTPITPKVSVIVAAYNEEAVIRQKVRNTLELDYPSDLLEIIVASDGSNDRTERIVADMASSQVHLLALPRRGKIHALKAAIRQASGEILVFSDANTLMHMHAIRMLVRNFADPEVGGVCGNQLYVTAGRGDSSGLGETLYWNYDKWLKSLQSQTGSIVSADGALYAIRKRLFRFPEWTAVTDDFAISTAVIQMGYRLVFEPSALAYEKPTGAANREFKRKVRLMNRGMRGVVLRRRLLNPFRYGFYSIVLFSHKVVRRLAPVFLIALLVSGIALIPRDGAYALGAFLQIGFYALALIGWRARGHRAGRAKIISIPFFYCLANAAALVAITKLMRGEKIETWQPQRRGLAA
jgi:cellulose synthase/poly-beta-1,6-N-acetylglucosamine synthase-like glycosyltransferase